MGLYESKRWRRKRERILKRDKYLCQECKKYGRAVDAQTVHHIKPVEEYPEMVFMDDNLVSLCYHCHNKMHPEKGGYKVKRC